MVDLPTPLISPEALLARGLGSVLLLDARGGPDAAERYLAAHIEGARFVDLERDLSGDTSHPEQGGRHPLPPVRRWAERVGQWGIDPSTPVVIYDDRGGALAAARCWWMLRAIGHEPVAVLDGGLAAAQAAGLPISHKDDRGTVQPRGPYPADAWLRPLVDVEAVERALADPSWRVIDVRARARYRGDEEPLDPVGGHIPGAVGLPLTDHLGEDGRFLSPESLRAIYGSTAPGGAAPERTILSCGSGVTACHTLLAFEAAGLEGAPLYVGSFSEWSRSGREVKTGDLP